MKKKLFYDLMRFAAAKKESREKIRYMFLGVIYYFFLAKTLSGSANANSTASVSESGDDIYPLF